MGKSSKRRGSKKTEEPVGTPQQIDYRERQEEIKRILKELEDLNENPDSYPDPPIDLKKLEDVKDDDVSVKNMKELLLMESIAATHGGRKRLCKTSDLFRYLLDMSASTHSSSIHSSGRRELDGASSISAGT